MLTRPVQFTQYIRPNGRRENIEIALPSDVADKADLIVAAGFALECEVLTTGQVSVTITGKNMDLDLRICSNGPMVPATVEDMINKFDIEAGKVRDAEAAG